MTKDEELLDVVLSEWAKERHIPRPRAEAIRQAVLFQSVESDLPALSYQWWQDLFGTVRQSVRRTPLAAYWPDLSP